MLTFTEEEESETEVMTESTIYWETTTLKDEDQ